MKKSIAVMIHFRSHSGTLHEQNAKRLGRRNFPVPAEIFVESGDATLIRKRQMLEDLIEGEL